MGLHLQDAQRIKSRHGQKRANGNPSNAHAPFHLYLKDVLMVKPVQIAANEKLAIRAPGEPFIRNGHAQPATAIATDRPIDSFSPNTALFTRPILSLTPLFLSPVHQHPAKLPSRTLPTTKLRGVVVQFELDSICALMASRYSASSFLLLGRPSPSPAGMTPSTIA